MKSWDLVRHSLSLGEMTPERSVSFLNSFLKHLKQKEGLSPSVSEKFPTDRNLTYLRYGAWIAISAYLLIEAIFNSLLHGSSNTQLGTDP